MQIRTLLIIAVLGALIAIAPQTALTQNVPNLRVSALKVNVDDMDKGLSFYRDKLGFEVADNKNYPREVILKTGDNFKLVLNRVKRLQKFGPTESQVGLTLQVNNLDQAIERMKSLDVQFAETKPRKEGVGNAIYVFDPFGRRVSLMHQTIVAVEPFKEPRIYNFGLLIPDMTQARDFYVNKLGFVVRSERYLPLDLPLNYQDKTFAFMLHYRSGVTSIKSQYPNASPFITMVFETENLKETVATMKREGVKILASRTTRDGDVVTFIDPFGNVSELVKARG